VEFAYNWGIVFALIAALLGAIYGLLNKVAAGPYATQVVNFYEIGGGWLLLGFGVLGFALQNVLQNKPPRRTDARWSRLALDEPVCFGLYQLGL
jgi:uncharacterized membrane protein